MWLRDIASFLFHFLIFFSLIGSVKSFLVDFFFFSVIFASIFRIHCAHSFLEFGRLFVAFKSKIGIPRMSSLSVNLEEMGHALCLLYIGLSASAYKRSMYISPRNILCLFTQCPFEPLGESNVGSMHRIICPIVADLPHQSTLDRGPKSRRREQALCCLGE